MENLAKELSLQFNFLVKLMEKYVVYWIISFQKQFNKTPIFIDKLKAKDLILVILSGFPIVLPLELDII